MVGWGMPTELSKAWDFNIDDTIAQSTAAILESSVARWHCRAKKFIFHVVCGLIVLSGSIQERTLIVRRSVSGL
jgi:hypothetical protein